jgi:hypothetical protein
MTAAETSARSAHCSAYLKEIFVDTVLASDGHALKGAENWWRGSILRNLVNKERRGGKEGRKEGKPGGKEGGKVK